MNEQKFQPLMEKRYKFLKWNKIVNSKFKYPGMVRIRTIGDGSCYFHAILNSYFVPYRSERVNDQIVPRKETVKQFRATLAWQLEQPSDANNPCSPRVYDVLSRGELANMAEHVPNYSLVNLQRQLLSDEAVDNMYQELISNSIGMDIYILSAENLDVYITGDDDPILYKNRPSIVLLYIPGHYELVGIKKKDGQIPTLFSPESDFIRAIKKRTKELKQERISNYKKESDYEDIDSSNNESDNESDNESENDEYEDDEEE
jgi:hypothetical protein